MSGGWWGNYLWLDLGSFFSGYALFFQVNRKNVPAGRPGQLSPDRSGGVFFRLRSVFFRLTGTRTPAGRLQPLSPARFGGVFPVTALFFQVNRRKSGAALAGQLSFHGFGDIFQVKRISRFSGKRILKYNIANISPPNKPFMKG